MTEDAQPPSPATMTPDELLSAMEATFNSGIVFTPEQATAAREWLEKLLKEGRGHTMDFTDPANTSMLLFL